VSLSPATVNVRDVPPRRPTRRKVAGRLTAHFRGWLGVVRVWPATYTDALQPQRLRQLAWAPPTTPVRVPRMRSRSRVARKQPLWNASARLVPNSKRGTIKAPPGGDAPVRDEGRQPQRSSLSCGPRSTPWPAATRYHCSTAATLRIWAAAVGAVDRCKSRVCPPQEVHTPHRAVLDPARTAVQPLFAEPLRWIRAHPGVDHESDPPATHPAIGVQRFTPHVPVPVGRVPRTMEFLVRTAVVDANAWGLAHHKAPHRLSAADTAPRPSLGCRPLPRRDKGGSQSGSRRRSRRIPDPAAR
jgi:hypothetical protein